MSGDRRSVPRGTPDRRKETWSGVRQRRLIAWTGPRERRAAPRRGVLTGDGVHAEALDLPAAALHRAEWAALAARAAEPNPFFGPEFLIAAAQRLAASRRPAFLTVRKRVDGRMRMIGLLPLRQEAQRFGFEPVRAWRHPLVPLGAPLLDRDHAAEAFGAMLDWVAAFRPRAAGLALALVPSTGSVAAAIAAAVAARRRTCKPLATAVRAMAGPGYDPGAAPSTGARKQLSRLGRRLAERGDLTFGAYAGEAADEGMAKFLALEASGWKGARGTALAHDSLSEGVARAFAHGLARENRFFVHTIELDGAPVAAALVAVQGATAFYWKTAYDERARAYSPGALLARALPGLVFADGKLARLDSCALPGNPIERLWPERLAVADLLISRPHGGPDFVVAVGVERLWRSGRAGAKRLYYAATGRKRR